MRAEPKKFPRIRKTDAVMGVHVREATIADVHLIHTVALQSWEPTYRSIISAEQSRFMFDRLLSLEALTRQIEQGEGTFLLQLANDVPTGFAFVTPHGLPATMKLSRLYLVPETHRKGLGSGLLSAVEQYVRESGATRLELNVNRYNSAQEFYRKMGYEIVETVDIPYHGFVLNDYVMAKDLTTPVV